MFSYIFTDFYRVKIEIKLSKISKNILRLKVKSFKLCASGRRAFYLRRRYTGKECWSE